MPTAHRQRMIEQGYAEPHHGHDARAVAAVEALQQADEDAVAAKAAADEVAAEKAAQATAEKRAAQTERHQAEREAKKFRKRAKQ